jgi:predicted nucleic acid-binding protein
VKAAFIADASIAMAWCFSDEATQATVELLDRLKSESAFVPTHWFWEVSNALAMAERRGRISIQESDDFILRLTSLDLRIDNVARRRAFSHVLPLARATS